MAELFELNPEYSTTRLVTREVPTIEEPPDAAFKTVLFLPEGEGRKGEGGLRIQGYFKRSLPDKPLITVITVVFNGAEHLEQTILSVIGQTYDNVEYILIDGGSTDKTLDIVHKYEHAIDYWVSEKDGGIYDAMNKGLKLATGDYIGMLNSDDWLKLTAFKLIAESFFPDIDFIYGDVFITDTNGNILNIKLAEHPIEKALPYRMPFSHQTFYSKRSVFKKINGYKTTEYKIAADHELICRIVYSKLFNGNYTCPRMALVYFRQGGISEGWRAYWEFRKIAVTYGMGYTTSWLLFFSSLLKSYSVKILPSSVTNWIRSILGSKNYIFYS